MSANGGGGMTAGVLSVVSQWPKANYVDPYERQWLPPVVITLWAIGTTLISLRIYLRARGQAGLFGYDDALMLVAWAFGTVLSVFMVYVSIVFHIGRHAWNVPLNYWTQIAYYYFLAEPFFFLCGCFTKVSILLFYRRLSDRTTTKWWVRWRWALIGCIVFTIFWTLALILGQLPLCRPVEAYWKQFDPVWYVENMHTYYCSDNNVVTPLAGSLAIFSDLYATALPMVVVYRLQMPHKTKIALYVLFSLGLLTTAFSIVRTVFIMEMLHDPDVSWNLYVALLFLQLEAQLGMICACLPSLRVFLRERMPSVSGSGMRSRFSRKLDRTDISDSTVSGEHKSFAVTRVATVDMEVEDSSSLHGLVEHGKPEVYVMAERQMRHDF